MEKDKIKLEIDEITYSMIDRRAVFFGRRPFLSEIHEVARKEFSELNNGQLEVCINIEKDKLLLCPRKKEFPYYCPYKTDADDFVSFYVAHVPLSYLEKIGQIELKDKLQDKLQVGISWDGMLVLANLLADK